MKSKIKSKIYGLIAFNQRGIDSFLFCVIIKIVWRKIMILIVEDDYEIQESLKQFLEFKGYQVKQAYHRKQAIEMFDDHIDLMIIDIQLPDGNGISLCQHIRQQSLVPIIFLTARLDEDTIVEALQCGGDDYVKKPFHMKELLARIESVFRRSNRKTGIMKTGDLLIDMNQYIVKKNHEVLELSAIGYEILFLLVKHQGTVITRNRVAELIESKTGNFIEDNTVSVHMKRLREKLGTYQGKSYIETVRGIGYRWRQE